VSLISFQLNSVEKDAVGNYLLSSRHLHTIFYISGDTGGILWRLGGKNSTFVMGEGTTFSWQHHARFVGEENLSAEQVASATTRRISLYDNASNGMTEDAEESQGMLLDLSFDTMTATLFTSYRSPNGQKLLSKSQGSMQVLEAVQSSNILLGYGAIPVFAEYSSDGQALLIVQYGADNDQGYRVFKDQFIGEPKTAPDVVLLSGSIYVTWNGDTRTKSWRVVYGDSAEFQGDTENTLVKKSGFETKIAVEHSGKVVSVDALDEAGNVLASSSITDSGGRIIGSGVFGQSSRHTMLSCK